MTQSASSTGVTPRAVVLGAVLVFAISIISPWAVLMVQGSQLTSNAIPIIAVVLLFLLTAVVFPLLKLLSRRLSMSRSELITVYVMMLVGSVVVTTGFTRSFLSVISGVQYYATPENEWADMFVPHIHTWLSPTNTEAIRLFYEGLPTGASIPWSAWTTPLMAWISFMLVFYAVVLCLGVLLRGQWVENERLVFPLTRLPLEMLEDQDQEDHVLGKFFRSRLLWIGFALPVLLHSWNSLHFYHDAFQRIALNGSVVLLQGLVSLPIRLNFPTLGLAYLMSLSVSFSVWFFFLIGMAQQLVFARIGLQIGSGDVWNSGGGPPALMHQQAGGLIVLALFVLWTGRGHFVRLWHQARRGEHNPDEILSPRLAFSGLALGVVLMVSWLTITGMSAPVAALLVLGGLIVYVGLSRIVCEAGLPGCQTPMVPQAYIARGFGVEMLGLKNMTTLGLSTVWMGETAANMMNAVVHGLKLTSTEAQPSRRMPWAIFLAIAVGLAGSIWITMHMAYKFGGINLHGWYYNGAPRWPFTYMASLANLPENNFGERMFFTSIGGAVMAVLLVLRQRFVWWPLHPIGFPVASTYVIVSYAWFSIFLAWLFKATILRYGGVNLYKAFLPLFLGLVLGEFCAAIGWICIDGITGVQGNVIFNF
jgi:uncharacterized protein DUF6785/uncharacterized protein DUF6784